MTVVTVAEEIVEEGEYDESNLSAENPPVALRAANSSSGDLPQKVRWTVKNTHGDYCHFRGRIYVLHRLFCVGVLEFSIQLFH
jgi:hypothetical protein